MIKNSKVDNDEINLIELMYTLWGGKWKIAVVVVISLIAVISYQSTKTNNFTAITEIKPIADLE
jgi:LPS O-antigen subunit length determinant protein (WzzB/FepE family)